MRKRFIVQLFGWKLQDIKATLPKIKDCGYTHILLTPVQPLKEENNYDFWIYYQPTGFSIGNHRGSRQDFIELCEEAHKYDIEVIVDVVLRHLANDPYHELTPHELCDPRITNRRDAWLQPINSSNDWDRWQQCWRCFHLPALNYNDEILMNDFILPFLDDILTYADGLRIDMGKHFALPHEGSMFWITLTKRYPDKFIMAECLCIDQHLFNNYAEYVHVLTNTRPWENKDKAVVFAESHDTYYTDHSTEYWSHQKRIYEYEELIKQGYNNIVFFTRYEDVLTFSPGMANVNKFYQKVD